MKIHQPPKEMLDEVHAVHILMIEDDPGDARLVEEAMKNSRFTNTIDRVVDGTEALDYLNKTGDYKDAKRPDLILLDLNMPKMDGRELLEKLDQDKLLGDIPVVVLSTSDAVDDIQTSYANHANCFITKPLDFNQFISVVHSIEHFWLSVAKLPNSH